MTEPNESMRRKGDVRPRRTVIVVPCYNEEHRLQPQAFLDYVAQPDNGVTFLFVNDGSRDRTIDVLTRLRDAAPARIEAMSMPRNSGKAEAVRTGILAALETSPDHVGFWDADLATPLDAIADLLKVLETRPHVHMVFGARVMLLGRWIERKTTRHIAGRAFATCTSMALRLPIYDTQCGAKIFRRTPELKSYFDAPFMTRWIFDVEILARALHGNARRADIVEHRRVFEFPLYQWRDIKGSKLKPADFVSAAQELLRIWLKYRP